MRTDMRIFFLAGLATLVVFGPACHAQQKVDIVAYFAKARAAGIDGLARKTRTVDVRQAKPGEIIVTIIKGEGKETQSPPAKQGDMVVRNRCPETGNEEFLVRAASFQRRYTGPTGPASPGGWSPYQPRGVAMRFVELGQHDGVFTFVAPWGEPMIARPGDIIVQDVKNAKNTYRIQKQAFACTYEVLRRPKR